MQLTPMENDGHDDLEVPSQFLFVNGDATSKSLSKIEAPKLRPVINRHVQRWSFETKGRKKYASAERPVKRRTGQKKAKPVPTAASNDPATNHANLNVIRPEAVTLEVDEHNSAVRASKLKGGIWSEGNYLDPFASTDIKVDDGVYRMLQYFTSTWRPFTCSCDANTQFCIFPRDKHAPPAKQLVSADTEEIVQNCMKNKTHMYALLASCSGRMRDVSQNESYDIAKPESYMAKAIHALREYLVSTPEVDQQAIRDVFFLFTVEYFSKTFDNADKFLRILKSMVEKIGGFDCIDTYDRRLYWCGDIGLALETGGSPILPTLETARIYHPYRSGASSILKMGRALQRYEVVLSPQDEIVNDMISCVQSLQCIIAAQLTVDKERMVEHGTDFLHRLLSLKAPQDTRGLKEHREECCRQALMLWTFNVMIWQGAAAADANQTNPRLARPLVAVRLRQAICYVDNLSSYSWDSHYELLLWMLRLGSCVAGPGDDQSWFLDRFMELAGLLRVQSTEKMSDLFRNYLYLETFEKQDLLWLAERFVEQRNFQTESPHRDMRMSSIIASSDESTPSSDVGSSSIMTLSDHSTPSSDMGTLSIMSLSSNTSPCSENLP